MARFRLVKKNVLPEKVVRSYEPIDTKGDFIDDGIFSERIFGPEIDLDNVQNYGMVDLGDNFIINAIAYPRLKKLMPNNKFENMIRYEPSIDENGEYEEKEEKDKYKNIGLEEFRKKFLNIMRTQVSNKNKELPEYKRVIQMYFEGHLFHDYIHVFSPKLRPAMVNKKDKSYSFSQINSFYNTAISHANALNDLDSKFSHEDNLLQRNNLLFQLQQDANIIMNMIIDENIKGKKGTIRKSILGSRVNYSSRLVIAPNPTLRMNEVVMNYSTFLELYRNLLTNLIVKSERITYKEANDIIEDAKLEYSEKIFKYMRELINKTDGGLHILLNRNPSISESSIQIMKIAGVNPEIEDSLLEIPNTILAGMGVTTAPLYQ